MTEFTTFTGERLTFSSSDDKAFFLKNTRFIIWGLTTWGVVLNRKLHALGNKNVTIWDRDSEGKLDIFDVSHPDIKNTSADIKNSYFIVLAFNHPKNTEACGNILKNNGFKNIVVLSDLLVFMKNQTSATKLITLGIYGIPKTSLARYYAKTRSDFVYSLLKYTDGYEVVLDNDSPDYAICDVNHYSFDSLNQDGIRIKKHMEYRDTSFDIYDYCIGYQEAEYGDRYFQKLFFMMEYSLGKIIQLAILKKDLNVDDKGFCSFLYSNPRPMLRNIFFGKLRKYKYVASAGKAFKTVNETYRNGADFYSKYKFTVSIENMPAKDYVTEKIISAFLGGTVPIYFGAPNIDKYFNPEAFINCHDYETFDEAIEKIIEIDNNKELYLEMLSKPCMTDNQLKMFLDNEDAYTNFLLNIFSQDYDKAFRRHRSDYRKKEEQFIYENSSKLNECAVSILPRKLINVSEERDLLLKISNNTLFAIFNNNFFARNNYKYVSVIGNGEISKALSKYIEQLEGVEFCHFIDIGIGMTIDYTTTDKLLNWQQLNELKENSVVLCPPMSNFLDGYEFEYIEEFFKTLTDVPIVYALSVL